ncbi:MAG: hypothetical protein R8K20_11195 [Gallionellaceae bacterium]
MHKIISIVLLTMAVATPTYAEDTDQGARRDEARKEMRAMEDKQTKERRAMQDECRTKMKSMRESHQKERKELKSKYGIKGGKRDRKQQ